MRAATLFSGIGAPEQARPDWHWLWHAEIEPFPAAVLAARHPGSANLGDVSADDFAERAARAGRPDVLVFGSPCQSFSVAGKRLGLSDARGNLALVALALVGRLRPRWFVFENVPGLLSSDGGDDFAAFLGAVAECGYSGSWRVLDARYWHLAQRRERVFFVGSLGDWRGPAAVLSLAEGLRGYPEKGREAGQDVARPIAAGSPRGSGYRNDCDTADSLIAMCLNAHPSRRLDAESETLMPVAYGISADCFDRDGEGAGGTAGERSGLGIQAEMSQTLRAKRPNAVAFNWQAAGKQTTLGATQGAVSALSRSTTQAVALPDVYPTLPANEGGTLTQIPPIQHGTAVRRLTPTECERLQGFPEQQSAYIIHVCPSYTDLQKTSALAALQCLRSRSNVWSAGVGGWMLSAGAAADHSNTSHQGHEPLVALDVLIDLERKAVRLHSQGRSFSPAENAGEKNWCRLPTGIGSFAHLVALLTHAWDLTIRDGKAASPASTQSSSAHWSGSGIALLCGHEIAPHAVDAANAIAMASRLSTSTTLPSGQDIQTYGSMLETLCCCVIHAIGSFTPEITSATNSFAVRLTTSCGYTAIQWRGRLAADGPRYKALGNSMAVPVLRWLLTRIEAHDAALRAAA